MSGPGPDEELYEDDPYVTPPGPTDYGSVPLYRRNGFCSGLVVAHLVVILLGCFSPILSLLGVVTIPGVIAVCVFVLTGPIYYNKHKKDGTLATWSGANKVAAVILLVLFVGGYGGMIYYLYSNGRFG